MTFRKGQSGNPKGRPRNSRNKKTSELAELVRNIVGSNLERIQSDLSELSPPERVKAVTTLMGYVLPKKQAVSLATEREQEYKLLEELLKSAPDEAVDKIVERINKLRSNEE